MPSIKQILAIIRTSNPKAVLLDGFDDALLGLATKKDPDGPIIISYLTTGVIREITLESEFGVDFSGEDELIPYLWNRDTFQCIAVYSMNKVIQILKKHMDEKEAIEYYYYNIEDGYLGENTPIFLHNE